MSPARRRKVRVAWLPALALLLTACPEAENDEVADPPEDDPADEDVAEAPEEEPDAEEADPPADEPDPGAVGTHPERFNLIAMAHTSPETVRGLAIEVETTPWDGEETGGPFSYASAPCNQDAPINNVSSNLPSLNTRMEDSRSPASTRLHPIEFNVESLEDGAGEITGTIELTVCHPRFGVTPDPDPVPDEEKDAITFEFEASMELPTEEEATWWGTFDITGGTGAYEGLQGDGQIAGYLMCLGPEPCAERGGFRDAQVAMIGTYEAPEDAFEADE